MNAFTVEGKLAVIHSHSEHIEVNLSLSTPVVPTEVNPAGGTPLVITGTNFPHSLDTADDLKVEIIN